MKTILFLGRLRRDTSENHVSAFAAQAAFFIILSAIPFILLLLTSVQMINIEQETVNNILFDLMAIEDGYNNDIYKMLVDILDEVYSQSSAVIPLTAATALWSAARAIMAITGGLNEVYSVEENRNYVMLRIRAAFYTVILIIVLALALVFLVFGNQIHGFFRSYIPLLADVTAVIISIRTIPTLAVLVLFFAVLYKYLPNRKAPLLTQMPGAFFTAIGWAIFSFGFSLYLAYFNGFDMYGSLTTVVLIMFWLYFCMYIMLLGAEINVLLEDGILAMSQRRKEARLSKKNR